MLAMVFGKQLTKCVFHINSIGLVVADHGCAYSKKIWFMGCVSHKFKNLSVRCVVNHMLLVYIFKLYKHLSWFGPVRMHMLHLEASAFDKIIESF